MLQPVAQHCVDWYKLSVLNILFMTHRLWYVAQYTCCTV